MNKAQHLPAQIVDGNELLTHTSKNPFTGEVDTWGGNLLAGDEDVYLRGSRLVFILAGTTSWEYGGPEEGGWWYDHFHEAFRVAVSVDSEDALATVLTKVNELLTLVEGASHQSIRIGVEDWPHFQRPHYE